MEVDVQASEDFAYYCRAVVNHIHGNKDKYPLFSGLVDHAVASGKDDALEMITMCVGMCCLRHFHENHLITIAADALEVATARGNEMLRALTIQGGNGKVH